MIYFLYGPNRHATLAKLRQLKQRFITKHGQHGLDQPDTESLQPHQLGELLQSVSLFAPRRMVVLQNVSQQKPVWEALEDWLPRIPDEVDAVIVETQPDKRTRTFKALTKQAEVFVADELTVPAAISWLIDGAKQRGREIKRPEAQLLVERVGLDQSRLANELNKLVQHDSISKELILELTEATPQATAFELLDAVLNKQPDKARRIVAEIQDSEEPYKLFGLFASQLHTLAIVVAAAGKIEQQQIAKDSGTHPYVLGKMASLAKKTSWTELQTMIQLWANLDETLKTTAADPWLALETTLMKIATR